MTMDLQDVSRRLFAAADQLWTNSALRPDQYAQPVLALIALRQMEAKFERVHAELTPSSPAGSDRNRLTTKPAARYIFQRTRASRACWRSPVRPTLERS